MQFYEQILATKFPIDTSFPGMPMAMLPYAEPGVGGCLIEFEQARPHADGRANALLKLIAAVERPSSGQVLVNGQDVGTDKYAYKLRWLEAVHAWVADELQRHPKLVVMGDFNIAPDDRDVHDPVVWNDDHILV